MAHKGVTHHNTAAEQHQKAAESHRQAAQAYQDGDPQQGAHHALTGYAHGRNAIQSGEEAARVHAESHGSGHSSEKSKAR